MRRIIILVIVLFLLPFVIASGSLQTGSLTPIAVNLCGEYAQYATISANNIQNKENTTLSSVNAKLYITGNPGLSFVTPQTINLGDINALSTYSGSPSWTIQCNSPSQGLYTAYVNYSTGNGYKASSFDEAFSVITVHDLRSLHINDVLPQDLDSIKDDNLYV